MMRRLMNAMIVASLVLFAILGYRLLPSRRPPNLGARGSRLAVCPGSPNCVSSQAVDAGHRVEPIPFEGSATEAMTRLRSVLASMPRTRIRAETPDYVHAEVSSRIFGFIDDLEFVIDPDAGVLHVRSASRVGHSDLGVNRARVERIRRAMVRQSDDQR